MTIPVTVGKLLKILAERCSTLLSNIALLLFLFYDHIGGEGFISSWEKELYFAAVLPHFRTQKEKRSRAQESGTFGK